MHLCATALVASSIINLLFTLTSVSAYNRFPLRTPSVRTPAVPMLSRRRRTALKCKPSEKMVKIALCSAEMFSEPVTCKYLLKVGTSYSNPNFNTDKIIGPQEEFELFKIFNAGLSKSHIATDFDWSDIKVSMFSVEKTENRSFYCENNHVCTLYQLVGECGNYEVRTTKVEIEASLNKIEDNGIIQRINGTLRSHLVKHESLNITCKTGKHLLSKFTISYHERMYAETAVVYKTNCNKEGVGKCQTFESGVHGLRILKKGSEFSSSDHAENVSVKCPNQQALSTVKITELTNGHIGYRYQCCKRTLDGCQTHKTDWEEGRTSLTYGLLYLSNMTCNRNSVLTEFKLSSEPIFRKWNIHFEYKCCKLVACLHPFDQKMKVDSCNAISSSKTCNVSYQVGMTPSLMENASRIQGMFATRLPLSKATNYSWQEAAPSIFQPAKTKTLQIKCAAHHKCDVYQVVGICGSFIVRTTAFETIIDDHSPSMLPTSTKSFHPTKSGDASSKSEIQTTTIVLIITIGLAACVIVTVLSICIICILKIRQPGQGEPALPTSETGLLVDFR